MRCTPCLPCHVMSAVAMARREILGAELSRQLDDVLAVLAKVLSRNSAHLLMESGTQNVAELLKQASRLLLELEPGGSLHACARGHGAPHG